MAARSKKSLKVFISYARSDDALARRLAERLRSEHFTPFLDVEDVAPGANLTLAAGKALEGADAVVVLLSKDSLRSPMSAAEWEYVLSAKKYEGRVLPVLTPGTPEKAVPWIWKRLHHVKPATTWGRTEARIVSALRDLQGAA